MSSWLHSSSRKAKEEFLPTHQRFYLRDDVFVSGGTIHAKMKCFVRKIGDEDNILHDPGITTQVVITRYLLFLSDLLSFTLS